MKTTTLIASLLLLTACTTQTTHVYKPDGNKQCEPAITSLADSIDQLTNAGIKAVTSNCAIQTGMAVITVCGAPTLGIHLHEIAASDVQKAKELGYEEASNLLNEDRGIGYEITRCP
ncbi:hypothetical protein QAO71_03270 [Halopseudomonas sp. SMJS2]|uniref:hypothetical protein n=1 Tax=Halopseudomonas sp. SMJS2 TaxID=3041098 RepID=UPI002452BBD5|nr:hypothetical protein [Halopseudomonas sp. SMJS2]WGK62271.1 hypothetical protein QAO71_03270 [Halopseudomonas sp. SMJS2]